MSTELKPYKIAANRITKTLDITVGTPGTPDVIQLEIPSHELVNVVFLIQRLLGLPDLLTLPGEASSPDAAITDTIIGLQMVNEWLSQNVGDVGLTIEGYMSDGEMPEHISVAIGCFEARLSPVAAHRFGREIIRASDVLFHKVAKAKQEKADAQAPVAQCKPKTDTRLN